VVNEDILSMGSNRSSQILEITRGHEQHRFESHSNNLGNRMAPWIDSPMWMAQGDAMREACEVLALQAAGLRWIVRTARRSEGAMRAKLWLHIDRALSDLESIEARMVSRQENSHAVSASGRPVPLDVRTQVEEIEET